MKLFLDTNVIIDDIGKRGENAKKTELIHTARMFGDISLFVSAKSYTDVFYIVNKYMDSAAVQKEIRDSLKLYNVCPVDADDIIAACECKWEDFEDALVMVAAQKCAADYLITNDATFPRGAVPTLTPQGFLDMMEKAGITYAVLDCDT